VTPEERIVVQEMVREMSRMASKILISGIILALAILTFFIYCGTIRITL
jgi:hypothetical protein